LHYNLPPRPSPACSPAQAIQQGYQDIYGFLIGLTTRGSEWWRILTGSFRACGTQKISKADFTCGSHQTVWLRCPGCIHNVFDRHHEWEARVGGLTQRGGPTGCPSVKERVVVAASMCVGLWRMVPDFPISGTPADRRQSVNKQSQKVSWMCREGHPPYEASCISRCASNTGCPICVVKKSRTYCHPVVSVGMPDLTREWGQIGNTSAPGGTTLGSWYRAWWVCNRYPELTPWQAAV